MKVVEILTAKHVVLFAVGGVGAVPLIGSATFEGLVLGAALTGMSYAVLASPSWNTGALLVPARSDRSRLSRNRPGRLPRVGADPGQVRLARSARNAAADHDGDSGRQGLRARFETLLEDILRDDSDEGDLRESLDADSLDDEDCMDSAYLADDLTLGDEDGTSISPGDSAAGDAGVSGALAESLLAESTVAENPLVTDAVGDGAVDSAAPGDGSPADVAAGETGDRLKEPEAGGLDAADQMAEAEAAEYETAGRGETADVLEPEGADHQAEPEVDVFDAAGVVSADEVTDPGAVDPEVVEPGAVEPDVAGLDVTESAVAEPEIEEPVAANEAGRAPAGRSALPGTETDLTAGPVPVPSGPQPAAAPALATGPAQAPVSVPASVPVPASVFEPDEAFWDAARAGGTHRSRHRAGVVAESKRSARERTAPRHAAPSVSFSARLAIRSQRLVNWSQRLADEVSTLTQAASAAPEPSSLAELSARTVPAGSLLGVRGPQARAS